MESPVDSPLAMISAKLNSTKQQSRYYDLVSTAVSTGDDVTTALSK